MSAAEVLTVKVIAEAIGKTERRVHDMAAEGEWGFRLKKVKGGKAKVFDLDSLPDDVVQALAARQARQLRMNEDALPAEAKAAEVAAARDGLADWQGRTADARVAILRHLYHLSETYGLNKSCQALAAAARDDALPEKVGRLVPMANARCNDERKLTERTLKRWHSAFQKHGWHGLVPQAPARRSEEPAWAPYFLKEWRKPTQLSLLAVMETLPARLPEGMACPSYHQARRYLKSLPPAEQQRGRVSSNDLLALKSFWRKDASDLRPLQVVTADGHTLKALVQHPRHGRPFAPELCTLMDTATRFIFGWSAGLAESRWVVMDCLRHGVTCLGQFDILYTDNGSGFVNETMDDVEVQGLMARIGAGHEKSIPGRAQSRGKIERVQGSLWKRGARELVTYRGRDMDSDKRRHVDKVLKKHLKEQGGSPFLMTWTEFLHWAQEQIDRYNNRPHRGLRKVRDPETGKMRHQTPAEALAEWREAKGWEPEFLPPEIVQDLFRPYEVRKTLRGEVTLPWGRYHNQRLDAWHGQKVRVGYDIHDGARVWVRELESGRLICVALRDGNVISEQPQSKLDHYSQQRATRRSDLLNKHLEEVQAELGPGLLDDTPEGEDGLPLITSIPRALEGPATALPEPGLGDGPLIDADDDEDEEMWERLGQVGAAYMAERKDEL